MVRRLVMQVYLGVWAVEVDAGDDPEDAAAAAPSETAKGGAPISGSGGSSGGAAASGGPDRAPAAKRGAAERGGAAGDGTAAGGRGARYKKRGGVVAAALSLHAQYASGALGAQALAAQNALDAFASALERLLALLTGLDVVASSMFYGLLLVIAALVTLFGVPAVAYGIFCFLLRPPALRRVPGAFGLVAMVANLPVRCIEQVA